MIPWMLGLILLFWACTYHAASASETTKSCPRMDYAHPDYDCEPFACEVDWPSEFHNYEGPTFDSLRYLLHSRNTLATNKALVVSLNDSDGTFMTSLTSLDDGHHGSFAEWQAAHSKRGSFNTPLTHPQRRCCMPTWECWAFLQYQVGGAFDGSYNLTDWKKVMCCIGEFTTPKPSCQNPPTAFPFTFLEPPLCSYDGESISRRDAQ
ncbi:hypothetical protein PV11_09683 [Exophiala sideris]|uniref:Uncharacterized protein n=1 Tax=Exophiala sideris TaxID=1016849 RepID=A0A0D1WS52_9EURO|nr:hypothetical protein PV11_09683 [Exophiala sideris]